jgi:hypothetical protein
MGVHAVSLTCSGFDASHGARRRLLPLSCAAAVVEVATEEKEGVEEAEEAGEAEEAEGEKSRRLAS